jgi:trehalose/maltose transport system substrate-binding protein
VSKVNELLADSLTGKTSRRDIMKKGAALGLSVPALSLIASAHGRTALAQDIVPGSTITVSPDIRTDLKGQSITVILGASGSGTPFTQALVQKFQDATGINTKLIEGPDSATDRLTIAYLPVLSAGDSSIDCFMIDVIWPGIMAEYAADLTDTMKSQGVTYFDRIVQNNTVDGKLVGIPWYTDAGILYYRKDLLEKYKFTAAPTTWKELEDQATAIVAGERASNPDFQGFVYQGKAYEGLTCDAIEWQISQGGGNVIETDGTVSINNPAAVAAFERAKKWIGTIAPEGVTTYGEEESRACGRPATRPSCATGRMPSRWARRRTHRSRTSSTSFHCRWARARAASMRTASAVGR